MDHETAVRKERTLDSMIIVHAFVRCNCPLKRKTALRSAEDIPQNSFVLFRIKNNRWCRPKKLHQTNLILTNKDDKLLKTYIV